MKRQILIILVLTLILTVVDCWHSTYLNPRLMPAMAATCTEGGRIVSIRGGGVQIRRSPNNVFTAQVGTTLCCEDDLKPGPGVTVTISCNNLGGNRNLLGDGRSEYSVYSTCEPSQATQESPCGGIGGGNMPPKG